MQKKKINLAALLCALKEGQQRQPSSFHTAPFSNKICLSNKPGKTGIIKGQSERCRNLAVSEMKDAFFK